MPTWPNSDRLKRSSKYVCPPFVAVKQYLKLYPIDADIQLLCQQLEPP